MPTVRSLRRSQGLTFVELALLSGIATRTLVEIEYGYATLSQDYCHRLAQIFGVAPAMLYGAAVPPRQQTASGGARIVPLALGGLAGALLAPALLQAQAGTPPSPRQAADSPRAEAIVAGLQPALRLVITPAAATVPPPATATPTAPPTATPIPTASPTPAFELRDDGPHGCPLRSNGVPVVITQPYGVGTHAPASTWGAVDLVLEGAPTLGAAVLATHAGVARVFPNSWPGGNFVLLEHQPSGWASAYAHLDAMFVVEGQLVEAGQQIGTVGLTGLTSGPHLHYEVRQPGVGNIDPAPLIACGG